MTRKGYAETIEVNKGMMRKIHRSIVDLLVSAEVEPHELDHVVCLLSEYCDCAVYVGRYGGLLWASEANGFDGFRYDGKAVIADNKEVI